MTFTSNSERPHQPVRIITKHIGRCGEYADMRAAIGRLGLIPTTSILCISGDHTWNHIWDEEWVHWDGYIDNPLVYEQGWGKVFEQDSCSSRNLGYCRQIAAVDRSQA